MDLTTTESQDGEEDWRNISDPKRRKRVQNRLSQRKRRQRCRQSYDGEASKGSQQASGLGEAFEDFGLGDMSVDLAFSPSSQNDYGDSFRNSEPGLVEDFLVPDSFSVDDFQRSFDALDSLETEQPLSKTTVVPPSHVHSTCCCGKPHFGSDSILASSRRPSQSHLPSLLLAETQDIRSVPCNHTVPPAEPQAYPLASRLPSECCPRRAQNIDNRSVSMSGVSQKMQRTPKSARAQLMDRMRSGQSSVRSASYGGDSQGPMFDDGGCDHVECQQYGPSSPRREARTQFSRRESSHPSQSRLTTSTNQAILAEHGIDLVDILRVSSRNRRQSQSDGTLPLNNSVSGQRQRVTKVLSQLAKPDRIEEGEEGEEGEARCDKIVILYLRGDSEEGDN
ncbi:uncharacterized protein LY89DRAFT_666480 [Mollisia scopiformis]|uniref:BZIP domain-containing protein n=1 Tax=Mollisia scopiformis TaxID=149040 RepID=A0A194XKZ5_MOLSC|nr:uncharacterized protein LY89DRAFT_666480 [Mollisia scopiformis]KUJ20848.1 hypothetical protein LY89DRAFT_666480 [Mollisia scopiformis]